MSDIVTLKNKKTGEIVRVRRKVKDEKQLPPAQRQVAQQQGDPGFGEHQKVLGQIFNVPGAAIRSDIQGTGFARGAINPSKVP